MYKDTVVFRLPFLMLAAASLLFSAVEFLGMSAIRNGDHVQLNWATASETENQGFILERKCDSLAAWGPLSDYLHNDALRGLGTVSYRTDYSYTDSTVSPGEYYYYRLSGIDNANNIGILDSAVIFLSATSVKRPLPVTFELTAFPNPFNPRINFAFSVAPGEIPEMEIYDLLGNKVCMLPADKPLTGRITMRWDAAGAGAGVYLAVLKINGIPRSSRKLLLLK